jgi:hypothetical protein
MTDLYADNALSLVANQGSAKTLLEQLRDVVAELLGGSAGTTLTIAGGAVTPTRATHRIDTEGAAGTDDLDTIAQDNHGESRLLLLRAANAAHVVTVRHNIGGAGKVLLNDGASFVLNSTKKWLLLMREGTTWIEVDRFYGDRLEEMRAWLQLEPDTVSTAADRNITAADRGKVLTLTGASNRTFTFTATWAALGDGWSCYVKNASTAFLSILPAAGTIDGASSLVLKPGEIVELRSDGANGETIGGKLVWRERLTAARTYYVRADGNDANTGLVNSAGGAFLTAQKAANVIKDTLDLAGFVVTVQYGDGTYTGGVIIQGFCVGQQNYSSIVFQGNNAAPANVTVHTTALGWCFYARSGAQFTVKDLKVQTTTSGSCIRSVFPGSIVICRSLNFGPCAFNHVDASFQAYLSLNNGDPYTISGGAVRHMQATHNGMIDASAGATITLTGTPAFSQEFVGADLGGVVQAVGNTYSGAATGKRYEITTNANIITGGGGANYFPGNVAGTNDGTGTYA